MPALPSSLDQRSGNGERLAVSLTFRNQTARFFVDFAGERFRGYGPHPVPPTGTSVPWNAANVSTELTVAQKAEARAEGYYVGSYVPVRRTVYGANSCALRVLPRHHLFIVDCIRFMIYYKTNERLRQYNI